MVLELAKNRINQRPESKAKQFALSVYFESIDSFIKYYEVEAKSSTLSLGNKTDLYLSKLQNRLFGCDYEEELKELLTDCIKAKKEFLNEISNLYENQYKKEFNFFSFKEQTNFEWTFKSDAITHLKYYLKYKELCDTIGDKLSLTKAENPADQNETNPSTFKNNFDRTEEKEVFDHFAKNLVEKRYLKQETLNRYLKQAFELKTPPQQKFRFDDIDTKENIVNVFYKYYDIAGRAYGRQPEYLNLLKDYFTGFEKINTRNFSK